MRWRALSGDTDESARLSSSHERRQLNFEKGRSMRIVLSDFISLDGVVQAPGGAEEDTDGGFANGGWSMPFFDPEAMGPVFNDVIATTEGLLFGRRTWETMAGAWPERAGDPFADQMNAIQKYVASRTLTQESLAWNNSTLLDSNDVVSAIRKLKAEDGGDLTVMGSPTLARTLVEADLVDEYRLMIEPILLGGGKSIFPTDGAARPLELVDVVTASTGVLICTYRSKA
jgi:dihydrofolate reductase